MGDFTDDGSLSGGPQIGLVPYFIHISLLRQILPSPIGGELEEAVLRVPAEDPFGMRFGAASRVLTDHWQEIAPPELGRLALQGSVQQGSLVGVQQAFYFRRRGADDDGRPRRLAFHAKLNVDPETEVEGSFQARFITSETGFDLLSRRRRVYVLGYIDRINPHVHLRPAFIGERFLSWTRRALTDHLDQRRVYPAQIDQFADIQDGGPRRVEIGDIETLRNAPEVQIKNWFAEIIGEPFVPKDWGGETSDLVSNRISIAKVPTSAAFLFKGPSFFRPMTIAALGKQGDQIDRLYREPADLMVLQHSHQVRSEVVNMMDIYAWDPRRPRRYCVVDGADTYRILRTYGKL